MSYVVLARKYRPQFFRDVVGQPHVTKTLLNGILQQRLAHAYLLSGPRGVGKTTTARILARAVNCLTPEQGEPCGRCDRCAAALDGRAMDVLEIDAASNNSVDDIRELRNAVNYAPIEGRAKVYIVDEVHMLSKPAFNALLKTLEEPPSHAYFCLATTNPQSVPQTILSRCQRFDFRRVSAGEIAGHLRLILSKEAIPFDDAALDIIARKADGSIRDSLSLLDQVIAFSGGTALRQDAVDVAGDLRLDLHFRALGLIESHSLADAFLLDEELAKLGVDPQDYIIGMEEQIILLLQIKGVGVDRTDIPMDLKADYLHVVEKISEAELVRALQLCAAAEIDVRRNFNPRVRLQLLLVKLASLERSVQLTELIERLGRATSAPTPTPAPPKPPVSPTGITGSAQPAPKPTPAPQNPAPTPAAPPFVPTPAGADGDQLRKAQDEWERICRRLAEKHNSRANLIRFGGYPMGYANGVLRINFMSSSHLEAGRALGGALRDEYSPALGPVQFDFQLGPIPSTADDKPPEEDPAVKLLMDKLGARLVQ